MLAKHTVPHGMAQKEDLVFGMRVNQEFWWNIPVKVVLCRAKACNGIKKQSQEENKNQKKSTQQKNKPAAENTKPVF